MSAKDNSPRLGISMGSALAMILSYDRNHSILYASCTVFAPDFTDCTGANSRDGGRESAAVTPTMKSKSRAYPCRLRSRAISRRSKCLSLRS